jgi:hypothetical protein
METSAGCESALRPQFLTIVGLSSRVKEGARFDSSERALLESDSIMALVVLSSMAEA